jgi:CubicO group peptidase (beta-lactamase class C family)
LCSACAGREFFCAQPFHSVEASAALFRDSPLASPPGERYLYSTFGYTLLSAAMEGAAGKKFRP